MTESAINLLQKPDQIYDIFSAQNTYSLDWLIWEIMQQHPAVWKPTGFRVICRAYL